MARPLNIPKRKLSTMVKLAPQQSEVRTLILKGFAFHQEDKLKEAQSIYTQVLKLEPKHFEALQLLGTLSFQMKNYEEAVQLLTRALELNPQFVAGYYNRGNALKELNLLDDALNSYDQAIAIKPDYAEAHNNRGIALLDLHRLEEAIVSFDRALLLNSNSAHAHNNRGNALKGLKRFEEAVLSYNQSIAIMPNNALAYNHRGTALQELKRFDQAIHSFETALSLNPDINYLLGSLLDAKMFICNWSDFDHHLGLLSQKINNHDKVSVPFPVLALVDSLAIQLLCSQTFAKEEYPLKGELGAIPRRARDNKIRIGYYSADYRSHAVAFLIAELFELHDQNRFELIAFSHGPDDKSAIRSRISQAFDQFIDVTKLSDQAIAQLSRQMDIDIAVDLGGYTTKSRTNIFAYRAAPIQVNYLGYPGTMGAPYMDYLVADRTLIPALSEPYYVEKIVYLPNTYQVNDRKRVISDKQFTRQELGLPEDAFVFCCFNNNYKITPETFSSWMRILKAVEGSVLWLFEDNRWASANLRKEAQKQGIDPKRLIFAPRMALPEHLARHRQADLFIDTLPYNAHTTASDALWAGLPVLTLIGQSFAARVAASLLNAIDLPELITHTREEYEALAIELASHPHKLATIKQKLAENRLTTPLFDAPLFTKHLEAAYTQMMERYWAELAPEYIEVKNEGY